jgi:DNA helicase-2/ATP-dependent DNA helicase PcrA
MRLNEEQLKAATHPQGEAALLLAGAGAGKTATLTERIVWLIGQGVPARKILAITFTNRAAGEIRERVLEATGLTEDTGPRLSTIHSLCLSMVRRNPVGFGYQPGITPLDDWDSSQLYKQIIERERATDKAFEEMNFLRVKEKVSFHRARGVGFVSDYTEEVHDRALRAYGGYHALAPMELHVWESVEIEAKARNQLTFDDMIWVCIRRCEQDPQWAVKVQALFEHVIVDEVQDTSASLFRLINHLVGPGNRNILITGDLSQSIFGFSGASPQLILDFMDEWRGARPALYRLVRNHRSVPEVVTLANAIQDRMTGFPSLAMVSHRGEQGERGKTRIFRGHSPRDIADRIAQEVTTSKRNYRDFAILVRAASQVRDIEGSLVRARIPYIVRGGKGLLGTEEVRDVLSYIRFATNPKDYSALARSVAAPKRGVGDVALENLRKLAVAEHGGNLLLAAKASRLPKLMQFANLIETMRSYTDTPNQALDAALKMSGYVEHLKKKYIKDKDKVETKIENLVRLREMIAGLSAESEMSTEDVVFQLSMDKGSQEDERGSLVISTIHSVKGLEYPVCFVWNVVEGSLPHRWSVSDENALAEERRCFYVAVTRARDTCVLCIPTMVSKGQSENPVEPSRFLVELNIA